MKHFLSFIAVLCCIVSCSQSIFREGTCWEVKVIGFTEGYFCDTFFYSLKGTTQVGGRECMMLWETQKSNADTKRLKACLYTEGDKVYFIPRRSDTKGVLLYDFGLKEGECTTVGLMNANWDITVPPIMVDIRCAGRGTKSYGDKTYDVMQIEEYHGWEYDLSGEWICGLSSACGLSFNAYMNAEGGRGTLLRVTNGNKAYFSVSSPNPPESVEHVEASPADSADYTLSGRTAPETYRGIVVQKGRKVWKNRVGNVGKALQTD